MVEGACRDCEENAKLNHITNYKTICAKVEDVINDVVRQYQGKANIIGIVDPPRGGLHKDVVVALRQCRQLKNLIYVVTRSRAPSPLALASLTSRFSRFSHEPVPPCALSHGSTGRPGPETSSFSNNSIFRAPR